MRFSELKEGGEPKWYFFPDQCRHCLEPPCKATAESLGSKAITQDEATGAVLFNPTLRVKTADAKAIRESCPWDIPRWNERAGIMAKCTMCIDRIREGLLPVCVKACPTGAMNFGDREVIRDMANKRFGQVKGLYKDAMLAHPDDIRTIFLLIDDPRKYHKFAVAENTIGITRKVALGYLIPPLRSLRQIIE